MQLSLAGLWQLSPLTDLSIPQDDITFPAPLSAVLPKTLSEDDIAQQEWHLMHDIEVDDDLLSFAAIDLVIEALITTLKCALTVWRCLTVMAHKRFTAKRFVHY